MSDAATYMKLSLGICGLDYGVSPCEAQLGFKGTGAPNGVKFDNTNDWLSRGAGLTGAVDGKLLTFSGWAKLDGTIGGRIIAGQSTLAGNDTRTRVILVAGNNHFSIVGHNAAGTEILNIETVSPVPTDGKAHHLLGSIDLTDPNKRHLWVDDKYVDIIVTTYTNDTIDFTLADWGVGAYAGGNSKFGGMFADLWFAPGTYYDLTVEANRRKFIGSDLRPVYLGANGELPTGSSPLIFLGNPAASFQTNLGTGGNFTLHGTLDAVTFATGNEKCYNTRKTCQDQLHYDAADQPATPGTLTSSVTVNPSSSATATFPSGAIGDVAPSGSTRKIVAVVSALAVTAATVQTATFAGIPGVIRAQSSSGQVVEAIIEFDVPTGTAGVLVVNYTGSLITSAKAHLHRLIDALFADQKTSTTLPAPSVAFTAPSTRSIFIAGVASLLMSPTLWAGAVEDTDLADGSFRWSTARLLNDSSILTKNISATLTNEARGPSIVANGDGVEVATNVERMSGSGLQINDIIIVETVHNGTRGADPAGFTHFQNITDNTTKDVDLYWGRLSATSFTADFSTVGGSNQIMGRWIALRGCPTSGSPIGQVATGQLLPGTAITIPSVTTTTELELVIDFVGNTRNVTTTTGYSGWTNANLTGYAELADQGYNPGGGLGIASGVKATPGATGTSTVTAAASANQFYAKVSFPGDYTTSKASLVAVQYDWTHPVKGSEAEILFGMDTGLQDKDIDSINVIRDYSHTPTQVSLGENLGTREAVSFSLFDVPHPDVGPGFDKYWRERDVNPYEQGTLFGKLFARQPYMKGRDMWWYEGYADQALEDMTMRTYIVDSFNGPDAKGGVSIIGKDPLKLADSDKAVAPFASDGYLLNDITDVQTSAVLSPGGIGDAQYPASGLAAIAGNELVTYTRSGNNLTIVRGVSGTPRSAHSQQDRFQIALQYSAQDAADIIYDLLINYAGIKPEWINLADWQAETSAYLRRVYSGIVGEPTSVKKLIIELIQSCGLAIWWDSPSAKIRLIVLREIPSDATIIDSSVVMEAISVRDQPDKRVSQMLVNFSIKDPLKSITDPNNFQQSVRVISTQGELNYEASAFKSLSSRWIAAFARTTAIRVGDINVGRFQDAPHKINFVVFRDAQVIPVVGGAYRILTRSLQKPTGEYDTVPIQVTSVQVQRDRYIVEAEEMRFITSEQDLATRVITIDGTSYGLNLLDIHNDIYPALRPGDTITFVFTETCKVGSNSETIPAVTVGIWPVGFTPHLTIRGLIQACGGEGGKGANENGNSGSGGKNGHKGGTALYTRQAITMTDTTGRILGGGGGGAGGSCANFSDHRGGGGGGGAGLKGGNGGIGPGSGEDGLPGTETAGGVGGRSYTSNTFWTGPSLKDNVHGGNGGAPGTAGDNDFNDYDIPGGSPGAAGNSIDGVSYITTIGTAGTRLGPQVN